MYSTFEECITFVIEKLSNESLEEIRALDEKDLVRLHHSLGRCIRNDLGFWDPACPLTAKWHSTPEGRDMQDGVDCSEDHPDAVSMRMIKEIWARLSRP